MAPQETPVAASPRLLPPLPGRGHLPWWRLALGSAREALAGLAGHKLRSALAMMALVVGIAAVLLVLTVSQSAQRSTAGTFGAVGANVITVNGFVMPANAAPSAPNQPTMIQMSGSPSLTLQDVEMLRKLPHVIAASPNGPPSPVQAAAGDHNLQTIAEGAFPDLQTIRGYTLHAGSFVTQGDVDKSANVAVLGSDAAAKLFPGASAVGQQVRLNNVNFTVVGVLNAVGSTPGVQVKVDGMPVVADDTIIVPVTTGQQRLRGQQPGGRQGGGVTSGKGGPVAGGAGEPKLPAGANVITLQGATPSPGQKALQGATFPMVQVEADATKNIAAVQQEIKQALEKNHGIVPGGTDDFTIGNFLAGRAAAGQSLVTIEIAMGIVAAAALLLGGFGVANVLLAAVSERTREIGLRVAVGAEPADIRRQFLIEAVTLALMGGLVGSALGVALAANLGRLGVGPGGGLAAPLAIGAGLGGATPPWAIGAALGAALLLGLVFGSYPAQRAARLDPIQALRRS